uniref:Bestrophin homolog n=1 Tax=Parascaris univalens TaxID=6257 RepID=A0A915A6Y4_PARUN
SLGSRLVVANIVYLRAVLHSKQIAPMQDPGTCPSSTRSTSTLNEQSSPASTTTESVSSKSEYGESEKVAPRVASRHVHLPPRPGTVRVNNVRRTRNERGNASKCAAYISL